MDEVRAGMDSDALLMSTRTLEVRMRTRGDAIGVEMECAVKAGDGRWRRGHCFP
jgi:hypothetical protein